MSEAWYKEWCPECNAVNWICNGDEQDLSAIDIDAIKCRKCGCIFFLGGNEFLDLTLEDLGYTSIEDSNWEVGKEKPN